MKDNFLKGIIKENPVFVSLLSLCHLLAVTTSLEGGLGMGLMFLVLLVLTNSVISLVAPLIPKEVRIPAYIVIIASLVTALELLTAAYLPDLASTLGIFIPLMVVNCIVLGRAEAFASKNRVLPSILDAAGMAIGLLLAFVVVGFFREFLGTGGLTLGVILPLPAVEWLPLANYAIPLFIQSGGAFLTLAIILAVIAHRSNIKTEKAEILAREEAAKNKAAKAASLKEATN